MLKKNIILVHQQPKMMTDSQEFSTQDIPSNDGPFLITRPLDHFFQINKKVNTWNVEENAKYVAFINRFGTASKCKKEMWAYFEKMSGFLESRNICQCKSHDKKLFKSFKSV